jgi:hypothetical protein
MDGARFSRALRDGTSAVLGMTAIAEVGFWRVRIGLS